MHRKVVLEAIFTKVNDDEEWGISFAFDHRPEIEMTTIIGDQRRSVSVDRSYLYTFANDLLQELDGERNE